MKNLEEIRNKDKIKELLDTIKIIKSRRQPKNLKRIFISSTFGDNTTKCKIMMQNMLYNYWRKIQLLWKTWNQIQNKNLSYKSKNLEYIIECNKFKEIYIGSTQALNTRTSLHKSLIQSRSLFIGGGMILFKFLKIFCWTKRYYILILAKVMDGRLKKNREIVIIYIYIYIYIYKQNTWEVYWFCFEWTITFFWAILLFVKYSVLCNEATVIYRFQLSEYHRTIWSINQYKHNFECREKSVERINALKKLWGNQSQHKTLTGFLTPFTSLIFEIEQVFLISYPHRNRIRLQYPLP